MAPATSPALLENRDTLERNLGRALGFGALAGGLHLLLRGVPLGCLAVMGAVFGCVWGATWDRRLLTALALLGSGLSYLLGLEGAWPLAVAGAVGGALMVRAHLCDVSSAPTRADHAVALRYSLGVFSGAALAVAGGVIAKTLGDALLATQAPGLLASAFSGAVMALFVALASIAAHLTFGGGTTRTLPAGVEGELYELASRALRLHAQCGELVRRVPTDPARDELARALDSLTDDGLELASEWSSLETLRGELRAARLPQQVEALARDAAATSDAVTRTQLLTAAQTLGEQLIQLDALELRRERVLAKLRANVALLESARLSLSALTSSRAQLRVAELSVLARRLQTLVSHQVDEADANDSAAEEVVLALTPRGPRLDSKTH